MKKMAFVAMVVVSMVLTAEAARKSSGKQPNYPSKPSEPCVAYGCNDDGYSDDRNDNQSSDDTYVPGSGTYEGNDRDTGSDYINGMSY